MPLIARGKVLGALDLKRTRNPEPFSDDDEILAGELAARAAVCIDNARWYRQARNTALTLQRSLLPQRPPDQPGLEVASRYQPAQAADEVGGDWFDVIPLTGDKSALVVGDVMGSGVSAAATMGQLRTATRTLAELGLDPAQVLHHLDRITDRMGQTITTCTYAVYDPHRAECRISNAGHLPPVLVRPGRPPNCSTCPPAPARRRRSRLSHHHTRPASRRPAGPLHRWPGRDARPGIDERLDALLAHLTEPPWSLEETCDLLLHALRHPGDHDDVALLIARATELT